MSNLAPREVGAIPDDPGHFDHYYDMAREICRRVRHRSHLADDEIIVLAVVAAQLALARYVEPHRNRDPDQTLDAIMDVLDRGQVVEAVSSKMLWLLTHRPQARLNAPSGIELSELTACADPDEPSGN